VEKVSFEPGMEKVSRMLQGATFLARLVATVELECCCTRHFEPTFDSATCSDGQIKSRFDIKLD